MSYLISQNAGGSGYRLLLRCFSYPVSYNRLPLSLLHHYDATPYACQRCRAKTKRKIERKISYVRASFFTGSQFEELVHLDRDFSNGCTAVADSRVHGTTGRVFAEMHETERTALLPSPWAPIRRCSSFIAR